VNDISEYVKFIEINGGSASLQDIIRSYQSAHHMVILSEHKSIILKCLKEHPSEVFYNSLLDKWFLTEKNEINKCPFLYVSENKFFRTISEAMVYCFNKAVPLSQGYFTVGDGEKAWFPQPQNDNWENTLSPDGKIWYEKPKNDSADYAPDNCKRYVFEHSSNGYRFTGVFIPKGLAENNIRVYEIVDDKVMVLSKRQKVIVCRVSYMKYYDGITADDSPVNGGSYVTENNDAFEKNNFHKYEDGFCYGFVETKYSHGHTADNNFAKAIVLENISPIFKGKEQADDVLVVFVAFSPSLKKTVIVGWYDHATVFRNRVVENGKIYMVKCECNNAHLIPHEERSFEVPKANKDQTGIGQSNFWYIQKNEEARDLEYRIEEYISEKRSLCS